MLSILLSLAACDRFAVICCGSNTWFNYRHQADVFTIYTKLIERGYNEKNIILMAFDDVNNHFLNPFRPKMFHSKAHDPDVYPGTEKIDYKKYDISTSTFKYAFTTQIQSTTADDLLIYFDDHGGSGVLSFVTSDFYADDLTRSLSEMEKNGKYGRCFFGIESCYSGSVASNITAKNILTLTAANDHESSYADVFDSEIGTYLTNEFTNVLLDEAEQYPTETFGDLFEHLKKRVIKSHPCYFGDESLKQWTLDIFFGTPTKAAKKQAPMRKSSPVSQSQATYAGLSTMMRHNDPAVRARAKLAFHELEALTKKFDLVIDSIVKMVDSKNFDVIMKSPCGIVTPEYLRVLRHFNNKIGKMNPDDKAKYYILNNLVAKNGPDVVISAIDQVL